MPAGCFRRIVAQGWHPVPAHQPGRHLPARRAGAPLARCASFVPGRAALAGHRHGLQPATGCDCTLLACWAEGSADPWLVADRSAARRGRRRLVRAARLDRAGLQADQARRLAVAAHPHDRPERARRLWLAVAVATLWLVRVGGEAEDTIPESTCSMSSAALPSHAAAAPGDPPAPGQPLPPRLGPHPGRPAHRAPLPLGAFRPEPWPRIQPFEASQSVADPEVHYHVAA